MAKILAFSDIHTAYNHWDYASPKIRGIMEQRLKTVSPDFVATLGDIKKETLEFIAEKAKEQGIHVFSVGGNHDFYDFSEIPNVTDMHRKVIEINGKTERKIRLAGIEGCLEWGPPDEYPRGYDDTNAGIVFAEKYYTKERDYSWVAENFVAHDGTPIGKLPIGIDLMMFHCAPVNGRDYPPYESPPTLAKLLLTRHPRTIIHGHLHRNYETTFNKDRNPVKVISVCTMSPFDNIHIAGEIIELSESKQDEPSQLNQEVAVN